MAYKDEYEVPRLCLDQEVDARVREAFGSNARVSCKLHPPFLPAMGMKEAHFGPMGAAVRHPAVCPWQLFGSVRPQPHSSFGTAVDIVECRAWMDAIAVVITLQNHALAVRVAELPDIVRRYEDVKLGNVARYRKEFEQLMSELRMEVPCS
jgi:indolepyruvate ferredoxin oxidoreductase